MARSEEREESTVALSSRHRRILGAVLVLAALLRCVWIPVHQLRPERLTTVDSQLYLDLADSLAETGRFDRPWSEGGFALEATGPPEVFRTPGYPLFLAILDLLPGARLPWLVISQIALGLFLVGLTFGLARRFLSPRRALVAAAVIALDPGHVLYSQLVMSDVLFATLVMAALWLTPKVAENRSLTLALGLGAVLSAATSVRPLGLLLLVPVAGFLVMHRAGWRSLAPVLALGLLFPIGWMARNHSCCGLPGISNAFDLNLTLVLTPKILAADRDEPRWRVAEELFEKLRPRLEVAGPKERNQIFRQTAIQAAQKAPAATLEALVLTFLEMTLAGERRVPMRLAGIAETEPSLSEELRGGSGLLPLLRRRGGGELALLASQLGWNLLLWTLATRGCLHLARHHSWPLLLLTLVVVALVMAPSLVVGTARMRLPITPLLAILVAAGWHTESRLRESPRTEARLKYNGRDLNFGGRPRARREILARAGGRAGLERARSRE